jgi:hypothetical protein
LDRACEAIADFADVKLPYTLGHSPGVAALAAGAGRRRNKAVVRRAIGYNHGATDDDDDAALFSVDFVAHMPGQPPLDRGGV